MSKARHDMQVSCIEAFVHLTRLNSQPAVAKEMGCDQATVSRKIAALEQWLGRSLVYPGNPVEFTQDGEQFASAASEVLRLLNSMRVSGPLAEEPKEPVKRSGQWRVTRHRFDRS